MPSVLFCFSLPLSATLRFSHQFLKHLNSDTIHFLKRNLNLIISHDVDLEWSFRLMRSLEFLFSSLEGNTYIKQFFFKQKGMEAV